ncbi:MAG: hypothetical protein AAF845_05575 [Bacteroidota bacterium]
MTPPSIHVRFATATASWPPLNLHAVPRIGETVVLSDEDGAEVTYRVGSVVYHPAVDRTPEVRLIRAQRSTKTESP